MAAGRAAGAACLATILLAATPAAPGPAEAPGRSRTAAPPAPPAAAPAAQPAAAQETPAAQPDERPLDARLYANGLEAIKRGRRDEAMRILRGLAKDFPDSPHAAPALLKVAELIYPVAAWDQVGSASPAAVRDAAPLLESVATKYRAAREAPRAMIRIGYLALEPANPQGGLESACAKFADTARTYPDSDAADDAWFASGMCETLRGRQARAADCFARLIEESPGSPLLDEARFRFAMALSHLPDTAEAMLALQRVRSAAPDSRFAPAAMARIGLLHRVRLAPSLQAPAAGAGMQAGSGTQATAGSGKEPAGVAAYRVDPGYGTEVGAAVAPVQNGGPAFSFQATTDLAIDAQGMVLVASPKAAAVFRLDARGRVRERIAHPGPEYIAAGTGLAVYIAGGQQIAINARNWSGVDLKGADGRPPRDYGPVAVDETGRVHLIDRRAGAVMIYDASRRLVGTILPPGKDGRFVDLAAGADGGVFVLEGRTRSVIEIRQGKENGRISLSSVDLVDPRSLAVDGLGDLYVLDGRTGWVHLCAPDGRRLGVLRPTPDVGKRIGDPQAIAVDALGRIYMTGRKSGAIVRFQ
jgi:TolA-binding protein